MRLILAALLVTSALPALAQSAPPPDATIRQLQQQPNALGPNYNVQPAAPTNSRQFNITVQGALAPTQDLGCIGLDQVKAQDTSADLFNAIFECIEAGRFDAAAALFLVATTYAAFDSRRVADSSARDGGSVQARELSAKQTQAQRASLGVALEAVLRPDAVATGCAALVKIGAPDYFPRYLVLHGIGAVVNPNIDEKTALVANFDRDAAWIELLRTFVKCPENMLPARAAAGAAP